MAILRDPSTFQWYDKTLFTLTVNVYAPEVERRNWSLVLFAGVLKWILKLPTN